MENDGRLRGIPLGQLEEPEELKTRYGIYSDETLLRWMDAVTGSYREDMAAILTERGRLPRDGGNR